VAASLAAALIIAVLLRVRTGVTVSWADIRLFWSVAGRLRESGVLGFYPSRAAYVRNRRQHTIGEYVETARHELLYVGFWLAGGTEIENVTASFRRLLEQGCRIELVLLDPAMDKDLASAVAEYLGLTPISFQQRLDAAWQQFARFRASLPSDQAALLTLLAHSQLLTSSAFVFDVRTAEAKTLVDFKLFRVGREGSFGIELRPTASENGLYERTTKSFVAIRATARTVPQAP
jgi:hypothetical protein